MTSNEGNTADTLTGFEYPVDENMPDTHRTLSIRIFDGEPQRAWVRKTITVERLIEEIIAEFGKEQQLDLNSSYALVLRETRLDRDSRVEQVNIKPGDILDFEYSQGVRVLSQEAAEDTAAVEVKRRLVLESKEGQRFEIREFPILLGRPHPTDTQTNHRIIDLSELPAARTISRPHARLTSRDNVDYAIESIKPNNMVILNSKSLPPGETGVLNDGDTLQLGQAVLIVRLIPE